MSTTGRANELTRAATSRSRSMTAFGIIAILLGTLSMLAPGVAGLSIAMLLGFFVTIAGIVRMIWAFQASSLASGLLTFALGSLTLICGIALLSNPLLGAAVLTIVLAVYLILDGILEIIAGLGLTGGVWLILGGVVSILLGAMIWAQYPLSGAWAMGTLLGIKLFFVGLIMITGGSVVREITKV